MNIYILFRNYVVGADPLSVHQLAPSAVKVVAALGDSITVRSPQDGSRASCVILPIPRPFYTVATHPSPKSINVSSLLQAALGARARTILTALVEYRGVSWRCVFIPKM